MTMADMASPSQSSRDSSSETEVFRRFNRLYTKFIGTLNEKLLNSEFSLAEARVLYELATRTGPKAHEIAESLGLDAGYLSRLLKKFERDGLLRKKASKEDGRYAELALTARGKAAFERLDSLSNRHAHEALESLTPGARQELIGCMRTIERVLMKTDRSRATHVLRMPRAGDMGWVVYSEALGYAEQYGWNEKFEALVAKIVSEFVLNFDPARERCWIAELDGQHIGHIFLVKHPDDEQTAKLRLLFVERSARGMGLGEVLVNECVRFARSAGYRKIVLWTQSILTAAHHIYEKAGFRLVKEEAHDSFGHDLVGQEWELELN
jgi:DNA-binding MarR family transcriptional regulator/GNAT superfamily N-acetyltransferase